MKRTEPTHPTATPITNQGTTQTTSQESHTTMDTSFADTKGLSPAVQKHIGNLLKVSYQDLLTESVPDRFANLLDQLELAEKKGK